MCWHVHPVCLFVSTSHSPPSFLPLSVSLPPPPPPHHSLHLPYPYPNPFQAPDTAKYPCIQLAYDAGRLGGTMTCCLNAANEEANQLFRNGAFGYEGIPQVVEACMEQHSKSDFKQHPNLDDILSVDAWARRYVKEVAASKVVSASSKQ